MKTTYLGPKKGNPFRESPNQTRYQLHWGEDSKSVWLKTSWGSWTRTNEYGNQNPMSYQLDDTPVIVPHQGLEPWTR